MSDEYLTMDQARIWREEHEEKIETAMTAMEEHEKSIRNSGRWLVGLVATILIGYGGIAVTKTIHAEDKQAAIDAAQDEQNRKTSDILRQAAESQARTSAILEGLVSQSAERKENTDKELERNRQDLDRHRNRIRAHDR